MTGNDIGKLERGLVDRPSAPRCKALRTVCLVSTDAEIGLVRRSKARTGDRDATTLTGHARHPEHGLKATATPLGSSTPRQVHPPVGSVMPQSLPVQMRPPGLQSSEDAADTVRLSVQLDGREVSVSLSRRGLLQIGVGSFLEAFAFGQNSDMVREAVERPGLNDRVTVTSPAHLDEILVHLRDQWHAQVKTDNLFGPRFALASVLSQIAVVDALRKAVRYEHRIAVVRLGAQYAESAAWLYEDSGDMTRARYWTSQALEWAYEADDRRMLAWTTFRRAQQAVATGDAAGNRAAAQSWLATAYFADGQLEQAASTAHADLPAARSTGSRRILKEIEGLSTDLVPHRQLRGVGALLYDLERRDD